MSKKKVEAYFVEGGKITVYRVLPDQINNSSLFRSYKEAEQELKKQEDEKQVIEYAVDAASREWNKSNVVAIRDQIRSELNSIEWRLEREKLYGVMYKESEATPLVEEIRAMIKDELNGWHFGLISLLIISIIFNLIAIF